MSEEILEEHTLDSLPVSSSMVRSRIAQEIAVDLLSPLEIAEQFSLTPEQLMQLLQVESFRELIREAKKTWGGGLAAKERTRAKADMIVEDGLLMLTAMIQDVHASDANRLDALKTAVTVSSHSTKVRSSENENDPGSKFSLTLNFSDEKEPVIIETSIPEQIENDG